VEGSSPRSLKYMKSLAEAWPEEQSLMLMEQGLSRSTAGSSLQRPYWEPDYPVNFQILPVLWSW
jgi:hypothetical protein